MECDPGMSKKLILEKSQFFQFLTPQIQHLWQHHLNQTGVKTTHQGSPTRNIFFKYLTNHLSVLPAEIYWHMCAKNDLVRIRPYRPFRVMLAKGLSSI